MARRCAAPPRAGSSHLPSSPPPVDWPTADAARPWTRPGAGHHVLHPGRRQRDAGDEVSTEEARTTEED